MVLRDILGLQSKIENRCQDEAIFVRFNQCADGMQEYFYIKSLCIHNMD